jgi:hypothetical protein
MSGGMPFRRVLFFLCLIGSMACLAAAYGVAGLWVGSCLAILPGTFSFFSNKFPGRWLPPVFLWSTFGAAAVGILLGASAPFALFGAAFSVAAWDLMNLDRSIAGSEQTHTARFERKHAASLGLALGVGLLLAEGGLALSLPLPFPVFLLLVALDVFCLSRIFRA